MSDHISGPRALAVPTADITDVYAFMSPQRAGWLTIVLNTLPFAGPGAHFSEGLVYRVRVRRLSTRNGGSGSPFVAEDQQWTIDCTFAAPVDGDGADRQEGECTLPNGEIVPFSTNDAAGAEGDGVRVFAGVRWDPFIMDAPAALKTIATGRLAFTDHSSIYLDGKNVLGLVVELDCAKVFGDASLLGVIGETLTRGTFNVRIERVGRPEVKNMMLGPKQFDMVNRDLEIRDLYNMEDAFELGESYLGAYRARLNANLSFWDGLDGTIDWPLDDGVHPLTALVLDDFLVVDVSKPYVASGSYLEIELAARHGQPHTTCGGRTLNDDVIDAMFTLLVNAGRGPVVRDGVDRSTRPAAETFPYLSAPNPDPPSMPEHHH